MNFEQTPEFQKDLKRLSKKWRSIIRDVEFVKPRIESLYVAREDIDINQYRADMFATKKAAILSSGAGGVEVVKMRLDVADLGRSDKARIVFIAIRSDNEILFVELYAKNEKEREDPKRYKKYL